MDVHVTDAMHKSIFQLDPPTAPARCGTENIHGVCSVNILPVHGPTPFVAILTHNCGPAVQKVQYNVEEGVDLSEFVARESYSGNGTSILPAGRWRNVTVLTCRSLEARRIDEGNSTIIQPGWCTLRCVKVMAALFRLVSCPNVNMILI